MSFRAEDGEERYKAIGTVEGELYTAVHVWRGDGIRLISVPQSNANEQAQHDRDSGRHMPPPAARSYPKVIEAEPDVLRRVMAG